MGRMLYVTFVYEIKTKIYFFKNKFIKFNYAKITNEISQKRPIKMHKNKHFTLHFIFIMLKLSW